jgi:hypothetical protein
MPRVFDEQRMRLLVHRALILVAVAVVSGVLAYVVNHGNDTATPDPAASSQQVPDAQGPSEPPFRRFLPGRRFDHDGRFDRR